MSKQGRELKKPWVVRRSPVHGRGVFAIRKIRKGEHLGSYIGRLVEEGDEDEDHPHVLQAVYEDRIVSVMGTGQLRFLNHDENYNAEFRCVELYATRVIQSGDEIFVHYGDEWRDL